MHPKQTKKILSVLIGALFAVPVAYGQETTDVGTVSIVGEGDKLGTGLIQQEDTPKARSNVSRSSIDKARSTANPYQIIELLPGVNTSNQDATGLFGGSLSIRGFNSDQIGFTVNGAPVNDSGNFAVFPQEYVDQENLCQVFVTQGATDNDAPHVGATGGNVGMVSCDPFDKQQVRFSQSFGQDDFSKTFVRYDTGKLFGDKFKAFISGSKSEVDKWRGKGGADRKHLDVAAEWAISPGNRISFSALYNDAINHNFKAVTKSEYAANGRYYDFSETFAGHTTPVNGTAQVDPNQANPFYELSLNPARNALYTAKGNFQLQPNLRLDVEPYFWYAYATGGIQQTQLRENQFLNSATHATNGARDINGDGDTLDTVTVYRGSLTETYRPGATLRLNYQIADHKLTAGYWYERARHRQTRPATTVDNEGKPADLWLEDNLILRADGTSYQGRDERTVSTAHELYIQDSMNFLSDRLNVQVGLRRPEIERDYTNYANENSGGRFDYSIKKTYDKTLPSLGARYQLNPTSQVYFNVAKNFKAPPNSVLRGLADNTTGRVRTELLVAEPETAVNTDLGYRYQGSDFTFSSSLYFVDYDNRQATGFDQSAGTTTTTNVGKVKTQGLELEAGTRPFFGGWSAYASYSYTDSEMKDNLQSGAATTLATANKVFPNTPKQLVSASLQYAKGPFYGQFQGKYTSKVYSTLVNDESISGFTVFNLNLGYKLPNVGVMKNQTIRLNVSNLFDKDYLTLNGASGADIKNTAADLPTYHMGAPRFTSISYSVDF